MMQLPRRLIAAGALAGICLAAISRFGFGQSNTAHGILLVTVLLGGVPLVWDTVLGLLRGRFAADVVAALAIVGAAVLGEYFAGAVIVLMQAGGEALETYAMRRASASLVALLSRAPRIARRRRDDTVLDVPVDQVAVGDLLVLRPGDMVPVDCEVVEGRSNVDQSALTGEPAPLPAAPGTGLLSGSLNLEGALLARAVHLAGDSQYQQIVRLVEAAQSEKAPIQRLADQYAVWFTPVTLAMCVVAYLIDRNPTSVVAVLVVATPCPLILATPVAVIAGIGRAAGRGIVIRRGSAIEEVGRARVVVFDKTGTLTLGRPVVEDVVAADTLSADDVLRYAAAVEQLSSHHLGAAIAGEATRRFGALPQAREFRETPGAGAEGLVDGHHVEVGSFGWLACRAGLPGGAAPLVTAAHVCVDGRYVGHIRFADRLRPEVPSLMRALSAMGLTRTVMLTGDQRAAAESMARGAGIGTVRAELLPSGKVEALGELRREFGRVVMVGDGINDAPALAAASVGIAMGAHAPAAAAEAADIVLLVDDVSRVAEAIAIGRHTLHIARQSIGVGLGVSAALMAVAALGHLPPALGAVAQEALDIAVIVNALRAR